jgi:RNA polymerase sigma factor (TIGR02999 family)
MHTVTDILKAVDAGDGRAADKLFAVVYDELRRLAAAQVARESNGQTFEATALVHEAYLRLGGAGAGVRDFANRGHFFAAAAEAMRRILVERARSRRRLKRGGDARRVELDEGLVLADDRMDEVLDVHNVLDELERHDPQAAALVKLRFFAGFGHQEAAETLGLSRRAADGLWLLARTWLYRRLHDGEP